MEQQKQIRQELKNLNALYEKMTGGLVQDENGKWWSSFKISSRRRLLEDKLAWLKGQNKGR